MRHPSQLRRTVAMVPLLLTVILSVAACSKERVKKLLGGNAIIDEKWASDSMMLASNPEVLFTTFKTKNGFEIAPIGLIGLRGFRNIRLGDRGWHAFDIQYLAGGQMLEAYRDGKSVGPVKLSRGMWTENAPALDSIPGCEIIVPSALAPMLQGTQLFTLKKHAPPPVPAKPVSGAEVEQALRESNMLVATQKGIPIAALPKYVRTVHLVNTGHGTKPTLVVVYDDPEVYPDTLLADLQRPRHLIVFLDWENWGYKATWTYATLGNKGSPPRYRYLDYIDVDDDGKAEVLLGVQLATEPLFTIILRRDPPTWIEEARQTGRRCQR